MKHRNSVSGLSCWPRVGSKFEERAEKQAWQVNEAKDQRQIRRHQATNEQHDGCAKLHQARGTPSCKARWQSSDGRLAPTIGRAPGHYSSNPAPKRPASLTGASPEPPRSTLVPDEGTTGRLRCVSGEAEVELAWFSPSPATGLFYANEATGMSMCPNRGQSGARETQGRSTEPAP